MSLNLWRKQIESFGLFHLTENNQYFWMFKTIIPTEKLPVFDFESIPSKLKIVEKLSLLPETSKSLNIQFILTYK